MVSNSPRPYRNHSAQNQRVGEPNEAFQAQGHFPFSPGQPLSLGTEPDDEWYLLPLPPPDPFPPPAAWAEDEPSPWDYLPQAGAEDEQYPWDHLPPPVLRVEDEPSPWGHLPQAEAEDKPSPWDYLPQAGAEHEQYPWDHLPLPESFPPPVLRVEDEPSPWDYLPQAEAEDEQYPWPVPLPLPLAELFPPPLVPPPAVEADDEWYLPLSSARVWRRYAVPPPPSAAEADDEWYPWALPLAEPLRPARRRSRPWFRVGLVIALFGVANSAMLIPSSAANEIAVPGNNIAAVASLYAITQRDNTDNKDDSQGENPVASD